MTVTEWLKSHNRCPYCNNYVRQKTPCLECKYRNSNDWTRDGIDNFEANEYWMEGVTDDGAEN